MELIREGTPCYNPRNFYLTISAGKQLDVSTLNETPNKTTNLVISFALFLSTRLLLVDNIMSDK